MRRKKRRIKEYLRKSRIDMDHEIEEVKLNRAIFRKYPELYDDKWPKDWN